MVLGEWAVLLLAINRDVCVLSRDWRDTTTKADWTTISEFDLKAVSAVVATWLFWRDWVEELFEKLAWWGGWLFMIGMEGKIKEVGDKDGSMVGKVDSTNLIWVKVFKKGSCDLVQSPYACWIEWPQNN